MPGSQRGTLRRIPQVQLMSMRHLPVFVILLAAAAAQGAAQTPPSKIAAPTDVAAPPADAVKISSGLATKVLTRGTGKDHPTKDDVVMVQYTGWKTDGTM